MNEPISGAASVWPSADPTVDGAMPAGGRSLTLLALGAAVAAIGLIACFQLAYRGWYAADIDANLAALGVSAGFIIYIGGMFLFSYAWSMNDAPKALRLTLIIALASVAVLAVVILLLALLKGKGFGGKTARAAEGAARELEVIPTLGGLLGGNETRGQADSEEPSGVEQGLFLITCPACRERFTPAPPHADCPFCGHSALAPNPS